MQNRSDKFKLWLKDLTPTKVEVLIKLERQARLIGHVKALTGENDEKLIKTLIEISDSLRKEYEAIEAKPKEVSSIEDVFGIIKVKKCKWCGEEIVYAIDDTLYIHQWDRWPADNGYWCSEERLHFAEPV